MDQFDLLGPLPEHCSTTVLEASAGTGKTFTLAGLVTRYVAEGRARLDQMLLITFGRAATQELRERVRQALQDALRAFDDSELAQHNDVLAALTTGGRRATSPTVSGACVTRWPASTRRRSPPPISSAPGAEIPWGGCRGGYR